VSSISARCPKCGTTFKLKDPSLAGKKIRCRKCQTPFRVKATAKAAVDEYGHDSRSGVDPYGRNLNYARPGELPVGGKKIRKIVKTREDLAKEEAAKELEANSPEAKKARAKKRQRLIAIGGGIGAVGLLVLAVIFGPGIATRLANAGKFEAPEKYEEYAPEDSPLRVDVPDGWKVTHDYSNGMNFIRITTSGIDIFISEFDPAKEVMNTALSHGADEMMHPDKPMAYTLHLRRLKEIQSQIPNWDETPPEEIETGFGPAYYSIYMNPGWLGTDTGVRATIELLGAKFNVRCKCSEKKLKQLKPIFLRIIGSIGPGASMDVDNQIPGL